MKSARDRCRRLAIELAASVALVVMATSAHAATLLNGLGGPAGFGTNMLPPNDDNSSSAIDLSAAFPNGLNYFGVVHHSIFVNNNANVTFNSSSASFTPVGFPTAATFGTPMIALWLADVDTRSLSEPLNAGAYWDVRAGQLVVTWFDVGYYATHANLLDSFQLIITDRSTRMPGDFDAEFRFARCEWTTGDSDGGFNGLGGTAAAVGFDGADGAHGRELPGSRTSAVLNLCTTSNVDNPGVWRFQFRGGSYAVCGNGVMEATEACDDGNLVAGDGCSPLCTLELANGTRCTSTTPCRSGNCVDGFCCDVSCTGTCEACDVSSSPGTCLPVTGAPHGTRTACTGTGPCASSCDGTHRDACTFPDSSRVCGMGSCSSGVQTSPSHCDGMGACVAGQTSACVAYVCGATACRTDCASAGDCATGFECSGNACIPIADAGADAATDVANDVPTTLDALPAGTGPGFRGSGCACGLAPRAADRSAVLLAVVLAAPAFTRRRPRARRRVR